jgi:hypothetical protein
VSDKVKKKDLKQICIYIYIYIHFTPTENVKCFPLIDYFLNVFTNLIPKTNSCTNPIHLFYTETYQSMAIFSVATASVYNSKGFHYTNLVQNSFHKTVARRRDVPSGYMKRLLAGRTQWLINH